MKRKVLDKAKSVKNDEFYTRIETIERELSQYPKEVFEGKHIYLNCDSLTSEFYNYFYTNFSFLGISQLTVTGIDSDLRYDYFGDGRYSTTEMPDVGDFNNPHCRDILSEVDIVVTNPPFSLARNLVDLVLEFGKEFILLGTNNWSTYKNIYPKIATGEIYLGANTDSVEVFDLPDGTTEKLGFISWYTTLPVDFNKEFIQLVALEGEPEYYDNYPAINVDSIRQIPHSVGPVGVPVTILGKMNPKQFEILAIRKGLDGKDLAVSGKPKYFRVIIKERVSN